MAVFFSFQEYNHYYIIKYSYSLSKKFDYQN